MPLYSFYPCRPDGMSVSFATFELQNDDEARICARRVLGEHQSASHVAVFCEEREVLVCTRAPAVEAQEPRSFAPEPCDAADARTIADVYRRRRQVIVEDHNLAVATSRIRIAVSLDLLRRTAPGLNNPWR